MKTPRLETDRLLLREVQENDVEAIFDCWMKECLTSYAKVNSASANVLHKLGFVDEKEIPYECNGGDIITEGIVCRYNVSI